MSYETGQDVICDIERNAIPQSWRATGRAGRASGHFWAHAQALTDPSGLSLISSRPSTHMTHVRHSSCSIPIKQAPYVLMQLTRIYKRVSQLGAAWSARDHNLKSIMVVQARDAAARRRCSPAHSHSNPAHNPLRMPINARFPATEM